jgi:hypothetical protein
MEKIGLLIHSVDGPVGPVGPTKASEKMAPECSSVHMEVRAVRIDGTTVTT